MKEGIGDRFKMEKAFFERLKAQDSELRLKAEAEMGVFRKELTDLKNEDKSGFLADLDVNKLDSTDLHFYRRYKEGRIDVESLQAQLRVLGSLPQAADSRKLLNYLLYRLAEDKKRRKIA